jgi:alpha-glucosidase (family GH31 glycosyl hydrolase)
MFGGEILVAPVHGDFKSMEIYLPAGYTWIDYWSREVYEGGGILMVDVSDIEKLPLFVRSGSIIPMQEEANWIDPYLPNDPLILDIYPDESVSFLLIEDDGVSLDYQDGEILETRIVCRKTDDRISVEIDAAQGHYDGRPEARTYLLQINRIDDVPMSVRLNRESIPGFKNQMPSLKRGWIFHAVKKRISIQFDARLDHASYIEIQL